MIPTSETIRHQSMLQYGFGPEVMKRLKICAQCGVPADLTRHFCRECGSPLPEETLFDLYRLRHRHCEGCGWVPPREGKYCPRCGMLLPETSSENQTTTRK